MRRLARQGFTLVETLVALLITSIVGAAIFMLYQSHQDAYVVNSEKMALQADLRKAMAVIASYLRTTGYDPGDYANAGVIIADSDFIYITRDDNDNNRLAGPDEDAENIAFCRYASEGVMTLGMHQGTDGSGACTGTGSDAAACPKGSNQPLSGAVDQLLFEYFRLKPDGTWEEIPPSTDLQSDPKQIQRVDVTLGGTFSYKGRDYRRELKETVLLRSNAL